MNEFEYKKLQERLNKKIVNNPYIGNKAQIYKEAILAAKSILSDEYHRQNGDRT